MEVWVEDQHGERNGAIAQGQRVSLHARCRSWSSVEDPAATLYVLNDEHKAIIVATTGGPRAQRNLQRRGRGGVLVRV